MPIIVTFDLEKPKPAELNRIQGMFERLGWENLGNTAYRYPALGADHPTEDWMNHVIPALMLLRSFAVFASEDGRGMKRFSVDVQSSSGHNPHTNFGSLPEAAKDIVLYDPTSDQGKQFGKKNLKKWIDGIEWPYA